MSKLSVVRNVIWAADNSAHYNHLHVDVYPKMTGTPPQNYPGMSAGVRQLYAALEDRFGPGAYFLDDAAKKASWTHMGWYNRRKIAGSTTWSQHAWANALDIGPYYGTSGQQKFYDFLMGLEDDNMAEDVGAAKGVDPIFEKAWQEMLDEGVFTKHTDPDDKPRMEELAAFLSRYTSRVVLDEIARAVGQLSTGTVNLNGKTLVVEVKEVK